MNIILVHFFFSLNKKDYWFNSYLPRKLEFFLLLCCSLLLFKQFQSKLYLPLFKLQICPLSTIRLTVNTYRSRSYKTQVASVSVVVTTDNRGVPLIPHSSFSAWPNDSLIIRGLLLLFFFFFPKKYVTAWIPESATYLQIPRYSRFHLHRNR